MVSETGDHESAANRRGRTTMLVVPLKAFTVRTVAMLLGYEEALGLVVFALLTAASEVVAGVVRSSRDESPAANAGRVRAPRPDSLGSPG